MRLNRDNEWDRAIIEFLESIPRYYRSQEVKRILVVHIQGQGVGAPLGTTPVQPASNDRHENQELGTRLDDLFGEAELS